MQPRLSFTATIAAGLCLTGSALAQISFGTGTSYNPGPLPDGVAFGDFDGDGDLDMAATADAPDRVSVFTNLGSGVFGSPVLVQLGNGTSPHALVARDMDGDGDRDLVVTLKNTNAVQILVNNGGSFTPGASFPTLSDEARRLAVGDLDGDGDMDVVVASRNSNDVTSFLNLGGTLARVGAFAAGQEPRYVELADVTGDGLLDAIVGAHDSRQVVILNGLGNGTFAQGAILSVGAQLRPVGVVAADLDGDGDRDIATATSGNGLNFASVFLNTGGGWSGPFNYSSGGVNPDDIGAADFDLDGDLDLVTTNQDSGTLGALANLGGGTFGAAVTFPTGTTTADLEIGDLDGNGSSDVGTVNEDASSVTILLNSASGGCATTKFCNPASGSRNNVATIDVSGCSLTGSVLLGLGNAPAGQFAYALIGNGNAKVTNPPGALGDLCVAGGSCLGRYAKDVALISAGGTLSLDLSNTISGGAGFGIPTCGGNILPGQSWNFQFWHRNPMGAPSGFSEAIGVTFQ